jgi:vacuolar iron transporter family protein
MFKAAGSVAYFRNFIFGVEDGLVSTVAFLAGVSVTNIDIKTLFVSGVVLIFVEAFSMAAGSYLSEESTEEFEQKSVVRSLVPIGGALIMFFSYFVAGLIPLVPYLLVVGSSAMIVSIACTLVALLILGVVGGTLSGVRAVRGGIRAVVVGGLAIALGIFVGSFAEANFN